MSIKNAMSGEESQDINPTFTILTEFLLYKDTSNLKKKKKKPQESLHSNTVY